MSAPPWAIRTKEAFLNPVVRLPRPIRSLILVSSGLAVALLLLGPILDDATRYLVEGLLADTFNARANVDRLRIDLLAGEIRANGISVENRQWCAVKNLLTVAQVRIHFELRPLRQNRIHVLGIEIDSPEFAYETAGDGDNLTEALAMPPTFEGPASRPPLTSTRTARPTPGEGDFRHMGSRPTAVPQKPVDRPSSGEAHRSEREAAPDVHPSPTRAPLNAQRDLSISSSLPFRVDRAEIRNGRAIYLDHGPAVSRRPKKLELKDIHILVTDLSNETPRDQMEARATLEGNFFVPEHQRNFEARVQANIFSPYFPFNASFSLKPTSVAPLSPWAVSGAGYRMLEGTFQLSGRGSCRTGSMVLDAEFEGRDLRIEQVGGVDLGSVVIRVSPDAILLFIRRERGHIAFETHVAGDLRDPNIDWAEQISEAITGSLTDEILSKVGGTFSDTGSVLLRGLGSTGGFVQGLFTRKAPPPAPSPSTTGN